MKLFPEQEENLKAIMATLVIVIKFFFQTSLLVIKTKIQLQTSLNK